MKYKKIAINTVLLLGICISLGVCMYTTGYLKGVHDTTIFPIENKIARTIPNKKINTSITKYQGLYPVTHIVDGDTIDVSKDGKRVRVRLLGVNTPESVAENRPKECFGKEASAYVDQVLTGKNVKLELDPNKPEQDEYNRVLAYVYTDDGILINKELIEKGYGYEYTYHGEKYVHQIEFKKAQARAQADNLGLWSPQTCSGKK